MIDAKFNLFPLNTTIDHDGHLLLHKHRAADLVAQFGSPLYVYHTPTIHHQISTYHRKLADYPGPSQLTYASKAFLCPALVELMTKANVGLDVASAGEIFIARTGGAIPEELHLHGNNKTVRDLTAAVESNLGRIVVDNRDELALLAQIARQQQKTPYIWLRVTPNVAVITHHRYTVTGTADSKFGIPLPEVEEVAASIIQGEYADVLQLSGLHVHLGSHFHDAQPLAAAIELLIETARQLQDRYSWQLQELCPGGGWGVRYQPQDPPMPVEPFLTDLLRAVLSACHKRGLPIPRLILEPGRSLVARAGVALYQVGSRKQLPNGRKFLGIDGGLADNPRPALYQAQYTAVIANRAGQPETETVAIAGPFCESSDVLIEKVDLPPASPGDIVAIPTAGAYQLSMSSNYNGYLKPAVLFIETNGAVRLVQRRETFEDLIRRDVL
jgi:diaminopimelate decarboxylase